MGTSCVKHPLGPGWLVKVTREYARSQTRHFWPLVTAFFLFLRGYKMQRHIHVSPWSFLFPFALVSWAKCVSSRLPTRFMNYSGFAQTPSHTPNECISFLTGYVIPTVRNSKWRIDRHVTSRQLGTFSSLTKGNFSPFVRDTHIHVWRTWKRRSSFFVKVTSTWMRAENEMTLLAKRKA